MNLKTELKAGDTVEYQTSHIRTQDFEIMAQVKTGVIEEAFTTLDNLPCYWIVGEPELILRRQILRKI